MAKRVWLVLPDQLSIRLFVDTGAEPPLDVYPDKDGPAPPLSGRIALADHSLRLYVAQ